MRPRDNSSSFKSFLRAFGARWFTAMSGPLTVPFSVLALIVEARYQKILFGVLALSCAVFAAYWVWKVEREELIAKQTELDEERAGRSRPDISVEIEEVYTETTVSETGVHPNYIDEYFTLRVHLANKGRQIAVRRYELYAHNEKDPLHASITPLDHLAFEHKQKVTPKWGTHYSKVETFQEPLKDLSLDKTIIACGEGREGWVRFVLPEISGPQLNGITGVTLCVIDAEGNAHKARADKERWSRSGELVNTYHQEFQREMEKAEAEEKASRKRVQESLGELIKSGREIEEYKLTNTALYENRKPLWRGRAFEFLRGLDGTYALRFRESDLEGDINALEEIQKEFID